MSSRLIALLLLSLTTPFAATAQSSDASVSGWSACRAGMTVTRPFQIPDGALTKDMPRLVRHWNMNNKVNDDNGRCASPGTLGEAQEYVNEFVTKYDYRLVDHFEPDWSSITFRRLGNSGRGNARSTQSNTTNDGAETTGTPPPSSPVLGAPHKATTQYVDVTGPDGRKMRLSREVAARNQAASDAYKRKTQEYADTLARIEAERQASAAKHAETQAKAAAEQRDFDRRRADYEAKLAAQKAAVATYNAEVAKGQSKRVKGKDSNSPCARFRAVNGAGWKVNPCV